MSPGCIHSPIQCSVVLPNGRKRSRQGCFSGSWIITHMLYHNWHSQRLISSSTIPMSWFSKRPINFVLLPTTKGTCPTITERTWGKDNEDWVVAVLFWFDFWGWELREMEENWAENQKASFQTAICQHETSGQWFSTGGQSALWGHLTMSGNISGCYNPGCC